jgi:hypothetical protein
MAEGTCVKTSTVDTTEVACFQSGILEGVSNCQGTILFPYPFEKLPVVMLTVQDSEVDYTITIRQTTLLNVTYKIAPTDLTSSPSIHWFAFGKSDSLY